MNTLAIKVEPHHYNESADLEINGRHYLLHPKELASLDDLRNLLRDQPGYIVDAVIGMLKEMVA